MGAQGRPDPEFVEDSLVAYVDAERTTILDAYLRKLEVAGSPIAADPVGREQARAYGSEILIDLIASLSGRPVQATDGHRLPRTVCAGLRPQELLRAATLFHDVAYEAALDRLDMSESERRAATLVATALNHGIGRLIEEATDAYLGFLLDRVCDVHIAERQRIARELHDRVGGALSTAHRMLELHDMLRESDPARAAARLDVARNAAAEAIDSLRTFMTDLRAADRAASIEKALLRFIDSAPADGVDIRLRISGDETWASPAVCDETYLIVREAIRNALTHGQPSAIAVSVDIAPHELRALVIDDGRGFEKERIGSAGGGLSCMRERATLLGGGVTLSSQPARGTSVELVIPIPERNRPM